MNRIIKRFIILFIISAMIISFATSIYASNSGIITNKFKGENVSSEDGGKLIITILSSVLGIVRTIGASIAILTLMIIASKYIIASAGDRADIKKYAFNYIIGALILFGATGLLTLAKKFVDSSLTD